MYNLLKEKENHFCALDENSIAWKTAEHLKKAVFCFD
jgi:hypothetical protein